MNNEHKIEPLLTPEDLARWLQLPVQTIQRYYREGRIPGIKVGAQTRFRTKDVEDFLFSGGKSYDS